MDVGTAFILLAVVAGVIGAGLSLWLKVPAGPVAAAASWRALALQHGSIMLFFSVLPAVLGGFGTWFVPLQIGADDTAFPRLAAASVCLTAAGLILTLGGLLAGGSGLVLLLALHVSGVAILLCAVNLVATVLNLRATGMHLRDMPLFAWSQLIASCLVVTALPMMIAAVTVLAARGVPPAVPLQHLFRVLGYPGFCIMILPGFGVVSEIVATLGGRPLVGRRLAVGAMGFLAVGGFLVWAERLLRDGVLAPAAGGSLPTLAIAGPAVAMTGCWLATLWRAPTIHLLRRTPGLFALGFILVLLAGSLAASISPEPGMVPLHDVLSFAPVFAMFAGFYYWIGKMTGRSYPERLGRLQFWLLLTGAILGMLPVAALAAAGAALTLISVGVFALTVAVTLTRQRSLLPNPWGAGATTAEWRLPSPVPHRSARA